jgi:AraC-like DNA-binding protein
MATPTQWTHFYRYHDTGEVTALHAQFVSHRYPRHTHDYFVIGLVDSGAQSFTYRGARHITPAGNLFVVNPGEVHTGEAASAQGYIYRTLCLSMSFVATLTRCLFLRGAVITEPDLVNALQRFHTSLARRDPRIETDTLLYDAVSLLFTRHGDAPHTPPSQHDTVVKARDYIEAYFDQDLSLARLASLCSVSPFSLTRSFKAATGLPPHAYLDGVRLRHARQLLDQGEPIASVALAVGYTDQSHLTHRFRRLYGITPGQYRHSCLA